MAGMDASRRLQDLLAKIAALHKVNEEIIQRIIAHDLVPISSGFVYYIVYEEAASAQGPTFRLETAAQERIGGSITNSWRVPSDVTITPIRDLFNDKINYNVCDFASLTRLNQEMFAVRRARPDDLPLLNCR